MKEATVVEAIGEESNFGPWMLVKPKYKKTQTMGTGKNSNVNSRIILIVTQTSSIPSIMQEHHVTRRALKGNRGRILHLINTTFPARLK